MGIMCGFKGGGWCQNLETIYQFLELSFGGVHVRRGGALLAVEHGPGALGQRQHVELVVEYEC